MIFKKDQSETAIKFLNAIWEKGKRAKIEKVSDKRSIDQNSLYWLWLTSISRETGNEKNYLHDFYRMEFLPKRIIKIGELKYEMPISTTELDVSQFTQYLNKIQTHANCELGIDLPNPEDKRFEDWYNYHKDFL